MMLSSPFNIETRKSHHHIDKEKTILRKESTSPVTQNNSWSSPISNGQGAGPWSIDQSYPISYFPGSSLTVPHFSFFFIFFFILPFIHTPLSVFTYNAKEVEELNTHTIASTLRALSLMYLNSQRQNDCFFIFFASHEQPACLFRIPFSKFIQGQRSSKLLLPFIFKEKKKK